MSCRSHQGFRPDQTSHFPRDAGWKLRFGSEAEHDLGGHTLRRRTRSHGTGPTRRPTLVPDLGRTRGKELHHHCRPLNVPRLRQPLLRVRACSARLRDNRLSGTPLPESRPVSPPDPAVHEPATPVVDLTTAVSQAGRMLPAVMMGLAIWACPGSNDAIARWRPFSGVIIVGPIPPGVFKRPVAAPGKPPGGTPS